MQNVRLFLFAALGMLLLLAWTQWQQDYGQAPQPTAEAPAEDTGPSTPAPPSEAEQSTTDDAKPDRQAAGEPSAPPSTESETAKSKSDSGDTPAIEVTTDLLDVQIATRGGAIRSAHLLEHDVSSDNPAPFQLLQPGSPLFVAQTGLVGDGFKAPNESTTWQAERRDYSLQENADKVVVPLVWNGPDGLQIERRYIFHRDSYVVTVEHTLRNAGQRAQRVYQYAQLRREHTGDSQSFLSARRSFTGGVIYTPAEKYQQYGFEDMRDSDISRQVRDGWLAMVQHYFLAAWIPPRKTKVRLYSRVDGNQYVLGMSSPWSTVQPGNSTELSSRLYIGPKDQERLDAVADGFQLTVDYGWLTVISKPLFIALDYIHGIIGNWGWSIIILTLLIKLVFYKLSETSYRSMARMRKLQPRMKELKERYGEDKQRMNQELMQVYKEEKVNPLGGCLPIVIQIPVFIALYWVLLGSVELRQAPWILWINDLSSPDPWHVLPLIMGATMFLQQKLNPAPMDPIQQKVMMGLPLVFTVFFMFFPAGLVLYWITNNSLSILQQWFITRRIEGGGNDDDKGKTATKPAVKGKKKPASAK